MIEVASDVGQPRQADLLRQQQDGESDDIAAVGGEIEQQRFPWPPVQGMPLHGREHKEGQPSEPGERQSRHHQTSGLRTAAPERL